MKEIPIAGGKTALVDDEDYERVSIFKWRVWRACGIEYAVAKHPTVNGKRADLRMHRVIMNAAFGRMVDHRNGNGLDNRKENLRFCTRGQNRVNSHKPVIASSGAKGVFRNPGSAVNPWRTYIKVNGKPIYAGSFPTLNAAATAYNEVAKKHFGEFAYLNPA